jgi:hypothetical protein
MNQKAKGLLAGLFLVLGSSAQAKDIEFGGYTWAVRSGRGGPGPNAWDEINAWVYRPREVPQYVSQQPMPVHINLWLFKGLAPKNGREVEVIIHEFKFTPE